MVEKAYFTLSNSVYACLNNDVLILLDLKRDEYHGVPWPLSAYIAAMLGLDRQGVSGPMPSDLLPSFQNQVEQLLQAGLISPCPVGQRLIERIPLPSKELLSSEPDSGYRPSSQDIFNLVLSSIKVYVHLRMGGLFYTIRHIIRKKTGNPQTIPEKEINRLVHRYLTIRPIVLASRDQCLVDSLLLYHFLSRQGANVDLVFGVRSTPFRAHCWVENRGCVLNDSLSQVWAYSAIMIV